MLAALFAIAACVASDSFQHGFRPPGNFTQWSQISTSTTPNQRPSPAGFGTMTQACAKLTSDINDFSMLVTQVERAPDYIFHSDSMGHYVYNGYQMNIL